MANTVAVKIYPVTNNLVDLFFGEGWEDWTRVLISSKVGHPVTKQSVRHMGGSKRPTAVLIAVAEAWRKGA